MLKQKKRRSFKLTKIIKIQQLLLKFNIDKNLKTTLDKKYEKEETKLNNQKKLFIIPLLRSLFQIKGLFYEHFRVSLTS